MRAILTYHSIDTSGSVISVSPEAFRRHLTLLLRASVRLLSVSDLLDAPGDAGDAVALTFDDGFRNVATHAAPLLVEYGVPATLFVVTDCVGTWNRWAAGDGSRVPRLPLLDWDELGKLARQNFAIASHTATHPDLTRLPAARLVDEIDNAAAEIARRLGSPPQGFAYPYGHVDEAARKAAQRVHSWACGSSFELLDQQRPGVDPLQGPSRLGPRDRHADLDLQGGRDLPRLDMRYFERPGRLEQWGTEAFSRWVQRRRRLRRVRSWLRKIGVR